jgi:diguanylate cyclase (GGDEF)-like protein/PAS domain S-box-containing protein
MAHDDIALKLATTPAPLLVVDHGVVVELNPLAEIELGVGAVVVLGRRLIDLVAPDDRRRVEKALAVEPGSNAVGVEVRLIAGGQQRRLGLTVRVGERGAVIGIRDLTEVRRLASIIDAVADSTLLLGRDGLVGWQSDRLAGRVASRPDAEQLVGVPGREPGLGWSPLERIHPEDLPIVLDSFAESVANPGLHTRFIVRSRDVEDDTRWQHIEINGSSCLDDELGAIVVQVRVIDDGEELGSVGQTEGQFFSLADATPMGIVVADHEGRMVYANAAALEVLGLVQLPPDGDWVSLVVDSNQDELYDAITQALDGRHPDVLDVGVHGTVPPRWCRVQITPRIVDGQASVGLIATLEDVTAEREAREEAERLTEMLDATSDYVAVFRPEGERLYVNKAIQDVLDGFAAEGKSSDLWALMDDDVRAAWVAEASEAVRHSDVWKGELLLNHPGGRKVPFSALGVVRRKRDGDGFEWIAMLARDITELKEAEAKLRQAATHDFLTGLPNRPLFNDRLESAVARHQRTRRGVAVMFCDLDGFKAINDDYGHSVGDEVLVTVARRLHDITRDSDTAARVGGDEFVIVCEEVTDNEQLATLAERVIDAVSQPIALRDGRQVRLGVSVGIGVGRSRQSDVDADRLLTAADTAMYRAKARGGNTFRISALDDR